MSRQRDHYCRIHQRREAQFIAGTQAANHLVLDNVNACRSTSFVLLVSRLRWPGGAYREETPSEQRSMAATWAISSSIICGTGHEMRLDFPRPSRSCIKICLYSSTLHSSALFGIPLQHWQKSRTISTASYRQSIALNFRMA